MAEGKKNKRIGAAPVAPCCFMQPVANVLFDLRKKGVLGVVRRMLARPAKISGMIRHHTQGSLS